MDCGGEVAVFRRHGVDQLLHCLEILGLLVASFFATQFFCALAHRLALGFTKSAHAATILMDRLKLFYAQVYAQVGGLPKWS